LIGLVSRSAVRSSLALSTSMSRVSQNVCRGACQPANVTMMLSMLLLLDACGIAPASTAVLAVRFDQGRISSLRRPTSFLTRGAECPLVTGGHCYIWDCEASLGETTCESGYCLCKDGFCAINGVCVLKPHDKDHGHWERTRVPLRWTLYPNTCFDGTGLIARMSDCGSEPGTFELPVGGVGQLHWVKNRSLCLGAVREQLLNGNPVRLLPCSVADPRMQFMLPGGASGQIRMYARPRKCLSVRGGPLANRLEIQGCNKKLLNQQFGLGDVAPPPYLPCNNPANCASIKAQRVLEYCAAYPAWPMCKQLRQCPAGGCHNGVCFSGLCYCQAGFVGPTCEIPAAGPVPLGSQAVHSPVAPVVLKFAPAPHMPPPPPAPAPAPVPALMTPVAASMAPGPAPSFGLGPTQSAAAPAPAPSG